jgi:hypothetical protein
MSHGRSGCNVAYRYLDQAVSNTCVARLRRRGETVEYDPFETVGIASHSVGSSAILLKNSSR